MALQVKADGDLTDIHLLESSGYPLLDKAAIKSIAELRNVPGATQWLEGYGIDIVLPVRYRLQNSSN